ncbi:MAG: TolC family protein [Verrucomicrobiota bacterium]|jgi:outer membrane protein TolC|nr:TolC family protein [Verrucomicrobiota bacterium]
MNKYGRQLCTGLWTGLLCALSALAQMEAIYASGSSAPSSPVYSAEREMSLEDCIGMALANNLDYRIERITREEAALEIDVALGAYDPALSLRAQRSNEKTLGDSPGVADGVLETVRSKTESDSYTAALGGATSLGGLRYDLSGRMGNSSGHRAANPFDTTTGSLGLTLTQPLLKGFKTDGARYRVAAARKQSEEAAVQLENRLQSVLSQVESAWYALIQARESIAVQEDAVRLAVQLYEDTARKVRIGSMSRLDEKQAESQAASAQADLSAARQSYVEAQNHLKALVFADHRSARNVELRTLGDLSVQQVPVDAVAAGEEALLFRPDLREAKLALERQGLSVDYQRNQRLPALDVIGSYGVAASDEDTYGHAIDRMDSADEPFWTVGVALTFPLGNRAARNQHKQSLATAERMALQYRQLEERALVEVENAAAAVLTGWERILATRDAREYAEQALEAEEQKLNSGRSTSFVVLQLQRALTQARQAEIAARAEYNRQLSSLALATGTMLARHGVEVEYE